MKISSKYEETKSRLIKSIQEKKIKVLGYKECADLGIDLGDICYVCRNKINGKRRLLIDQENSKYVIDNYCYFLAKGFLVINN